MTKRENLLKAIDRMIRARARIYDKYGEGPEYDAATRAIEAAKLRLKEEGSGANKKCQA